MQLLEAGQPLRVGDGNLAVEPGLIDVQPLQSSPSPSQENAPAPSKPGGQRPTTPAPEPARPDPQAQKEGAKAALPPAPAEKMAPPIKEK